VFSVNGSGANGFGGVLLMFGILIINMAAIILWVKAVSLEKPTGCGVRDQYRRHDAGFLKIFAKFIFFIDVCYVIVYCIGA